MTSTSMQLLVSSACWVDGHQFYRCCVGNDLACWSPEPDAQRQRCCFRESPLSDDNLQVLSSVAPTHMWMRLDVTRRDVSRGHCEGAWDELRRALILQRPIAESLRMASSAYVSGPCLFGEICLALLDLYVRFHQGGLAKGLSPDIPSVRFIVSALPRLFALASVTGQLRSISQGWPLFSLLRALREVSLESRTGGTRARRLAFSPLHRRAFGVVHGELESEFRERPASARTPPPGGSFSLAAASLALRRGRKCPRAAPERLLPRAAALLSRTHLSMYATTPRTRTGRLSARASLRLAASLLSQHLQCHRSVTHLVALFTTPWPIIDILDGIDAAEPVRICPVNLLAYYRLSTFVGTEVPWPNPFQMRLLRDDSISTNIRASLLPFCGSPLYLRWVSNLWRGGYRGALRIVEGGSEAGSCLLWAAGMLRGTVDFNAIGVEPMPTAVEAFQRSLRMNSMSQEIRLARAALTNASSAEGLRLQVLTGRAGEASAVQCATGSCSEVAVPAVRLDELLPSFATSMPVHCLKLNVMGYEFEALSGAARLLREGAVCSVMLEELQLRGGAEAVRRLAGIVALLQGEGFRVEAFVRDHGEFSQAAPRRVLVQRLDLKLLPRMAAQARRMPPPLRDTLGFVVVAYAEDAESDCHATSPSFRPEFDPGDFGDVFRLSEFWSHGKE